MPGPVSDSYDPEFGTGANAATVRDAIEHLRAEITEDLGPELKHIVGVAQEVLDGADMYTSAFSELRFTAAELRVIRFCLDRAKESI